MWIVKKNIQYYRQLSGIALLVFIGLIIIQIFWLQKAVNLKMEERSLQLEKLITDLALEVNGLNHDFFHGLEPRLQEVQLQEVQQLLDSSLEKNNIEFQTYFAIYQDSSDFFLTSDETEKNALMSSNIKSCLSCIVSFSVAKGSPKRLDESDEAYMERITKNTTFRYYSPVKNLVEENEKIIWLSLYQTPQYLKTISTIWYLFIGSILLSLMLLYLFYFMLKSLAAHKQESDMKDEFFNNMTHEFKTPLSAIRLASRVLMNNPNLDKKINYLNIIEKESRILETQVDKLLELARLDKKELLLQKRSLFLKDIFTQVKTRMQPLVSEKKGQLHIQIMNENTAISGDEYHLVNCFCNLIENSLKYSEDGVVVAIQSTVESDKNYITLTDNGPGIHPDLQPKIFERFYRGQKGNQYQTTGFGIGLSYVKTIIEGHNGTIHLDSSIKSGARFIIKI